MSIIVAINYNFKYNYKLYFSINIINALKILTDYAYIL